jgi:DNA adenine methylase
MPGESLLEKVAPIAPVAPYLGGKRNLAARVAAVLAGVAHDTYVEPFVGMGGVFFRRDRRPRAEVINDASRDVATLFRVLQRHYVPLMDLLRWQVTSRAEFERLRAAEPDTLTDLERAARFLYLQRLAFGGKVRGRTFGVAPDRPARFDVTQLAALLDDAHARLASVVIECLPYQECLRRYDRSGTLFYLDPPYEGCEGDYGPAFSPADWPCLAGLLSSLRGRFVMSINDTPMIRDVFGRFEMTEVETTYTIGLGEGARRRRGELIIQGGRGR